ncbi:MAG TPA: hypothetical protein VFP25_05945 [Nitrososphaeraceae archaeon]|nr:hypothetical protein [Nitrososphaeraceae archaeon]
MEWIPKGPASANSYDPNIMGSYLLGPIQEKDSIFSNKDIKYVTYINAL